MGGSYGRCNDYRHIGPIISSIKQKRINEECEGDSLSGAGDWVKPFTKTWGKRTSSGKGWRNSETKQAESPHSQGCYQALHLRWGWAGTTGRMSSKRQSDLDMGDVEDTEYRAQILPPNYQSPAEVLFCPRGLRLPRTWNTWASNRSYRMQTRFRWCLNGDEKTYLLCLITANRNSGQGFLFCRKSDKGHGWKYGAYYNSLYLSRGTE